MWYLDAIECAQLNVSPQADQHSYFLKLHCICLLAPATTTALLLQKCFITVVAFIYYHRHQQHHHSSRFENWSFFCVLRPSSRSCSCPFPLEKKSNLRFISISPNFTLKPVGISRQPSCATWKQHVHQLMGDESSKSSRRIALHFIYCNTHLYIIFCSLSCIININIHYIPFMPLPRKMQREKKSFQSVSLFQCITVYQCFCFCCCACDSTQKYLASWPEADKWPCYNKMNL